MTFSRRQIFELGAGAAAALCGPGLAPAEAAALGSLDTSARARGRRFGTSLGTRTGGFSDPRYLDLVRGQCGIIVPENELKWGWLRRRPDSFDFDAADRLMAFAVKSGLAMRGLNLLWHHPEWMPAWVASHDFGARPAAEAERMIRQHVATVCRRYPRILSWDVVNEAVDNRSGELRETAFSRAMGGAEPVLDLAFHAAREAAPHAQLVYNDYMSFEAGNAPHRDGVLRLLEGFRRRGVPVDALGIQSHIGPNRQGEGGFAAAEARDWRSFVDAVVGMGYALLITELDVGDRLLPADIAARDRAVADYARPYLEMMLGYEQLGDVLVWGLSDRYTWLRKREPRSDALPKRPCPYDEDLRPKALRQTIAAALRSARPHRI